MTDTDTIARARNGDSLAQRDLYDAHVDRIYRLAFRMAGDDDLAREFTQEAFIRAFSRLAEFRGEAAFGTWLHAIATSVVLNGLRKVRRLHTREESMEVVEPMGTQTRELDPDLRASLHRAIDALPDGYRTVFLMHDVEGYTHEEIGAALGVQPGTSKAQLFRARAKLRTALSAWAGEWTA